MTIEYKNTINDFLNHQLYIASISERISKMRKKNKNQTAIVIAVMGLVLFSQSATVGIILWIIAFSWFLLYPIWEKQHYIEHYQSYIEENFKEGIGKLTVIELNDDYIYAKNDGSESKILTSELEEIVELPTVILIKLKGGQSLIIPKERIKNTNDLIARLKKLTNYLHINYTLNDKWEWK